MGLRGRILLYSLSIGRHAAPGQCCSLLDLTRKAITKQFQSKLQCMDWRLLRTPSFVRAVGFHTEYKVGGNGSIGIFIVSFLIFGEWFGSSFVSSARLNDTTSATDAGMFLT